MAKTTNYQKHISENPIQKYLINNFNSQLFRMIKPLRVQKVLDVGCGEGFTLKKLEEKKIGKVLEGVDYSDDAIKIGKKIYPKLTLKKGDIYNLSYKDNSFDLLICSEVLEHLDDPKIAIAELKRVSSKYVVFSVPNEPLFILANFLRGKYLKNFGNHPEHINHWSFIGFERFITSQGFRVIKRSYPFAWTLLLARKK